MTFPADYYVAAGVAAFLTSLLALPLWRRWCVCTGLVDDPGHRKIHDRPIPLAGGLAVLTGLLLPVLAGALFLLWRQPAPAPHNNPLFLLGHGLNRRALELAAILVGAVAIVLIGWLDDKHELGAGKKFAGQFLVAALVAACGVRVTLFVPSALFSYAITILWILTVINALNFMDNMNGLCAGIGAVGAWYFGLMAARHGQYLVALIAFLTCGALVGFLPWNFPRARAFLGDSGSHLTGYLLAVVAILPHFYTQFHPHRWAALSPLLVLAVPLLDLAWVVVLRWRLGQPFYVGDTNHFSHRLVRSGFTRTQAVVMIWALSAIAGGLACLFLA